MYSFAHLRSHLRRTRTDLVLDVGANAGQFALQLFNAGFTGRIISFEPLSSAHAALSEAAQNHPRWEVAPRCALGAAVGSAVINIAGNSLSSSLRPMLERHLAAAPQSAYVGTETVSVETLGSVIARRFPGGAPRFALKIDTQGFEGEVLDGLGAHVEQCAAVLLEMPLDSLYGGAADLPALFAHLVRCEFHCVGMSPGHKNPQTGDAIEVDGLFVRDVSALLTSVPPHLSSEALAWQREMVRDAHRSFSSPGDLAVEEAEPVATEAELAAAKAELAAMKAELAAFKASTSWRITAPLRRVVRLVR